MPTRDDIAIVDTTAAANERLSPVPHYYRVDNQKRKTVRWLCLIAVIIVVAVAVLVATH